MKQEIKEKWLSALRSGEYEQSIGCLKTNDNKFCCLGVLCDIYAKEKNVDWKPINENLTEKLMLSDNNSNISYVLPPHVAEWAEIKDDTGGVYIKSKDDHLSRINDSGESFSEISELIEKEL